jgi:hypothetical protein
VRIRIIVDFNGRFTHSKTTRNDSNAVSGIKEYKPEENA